MPESKIQEVALRKVYEEIFKEPLPDEFLSSVITTTKSAVDALLKSRAPGVDASASVAAAELDYAKLFQQGPHGQGEYYAKVSAKRAMDVIGKCVAKLLGPDEPVITVGR